MSAGLCPLCRFWGRVLAVLSSSWWPQAARGSWPHPLSLPLCLHLAPPLYAWVSISSYEDISHEVYSPS